MARRIKEDIEVHQNRIAESARKLFSKKGIESTSMDEISKSAGYSKATLYVYFKNKEDIVSFLTLKGMSILKDVLVKALDKDRNSKESFILLCHALKDYQYKYPDFFDSTLDYIQLDVNKEDESLQNRIYQVGEDINHILMEYLKFGIKREEICICDNYFETIFHIWGMISGLIKLASKKELYIKLAGDISKEKFLEDGFQKVYEIISAREIS